MRKIFFVAAFACAAALFASEGGRKQTTIKVSVSNPADVVRTAEPVVVKLMDVKGVKCEVKSALVKSDGVSVPCQLDDMDGDFVNDELFFVTNLAPRETKVFDVVLSDGAEQTAESGKSGVYVALQLRDKKDLHPDVTKVEAPGATNIFNDIYMHGITLESEITGYRIYFDERQNVDLYGKKYRRIELPVTQFYTTPEQLAQGYGVDVLWAGKAIGCGSFKQYEDGAPKNWTDVGLRGQRIVTQGRLRTVVEVYDLHVKGSDGKANGGYYDVRQYYTLVAGHRDMRVDVCFKNIGGQQFCTGVQKVGVTAVDSVRRGHKPVGFVRADGVAASWGCDYPDMGKKQIWAPEAIGMAVYVPRDYVADKREDELNYLYVLGGKGEERMHYYLTFCADKEADGYHNADDWFASLDAWKANLDAPVKIKIVK